MYIHTGTYIHTCTCWVREIGVGTALEGEELGLAAIVGQSRGGRGEMRTGRLSVV